MGPAGWCSARGRILPLFPQFLHSFHRKLQNLSKVSLQIFNLLRHLMLHPPGLSRQPLSHSSPSSLPRVSLPWRLATVTPFESFLNHSNSRLPFIQLFDEKPTLGTKIDAHTQLHPGGLLPFLGVLCQAFLFDMISNIISSFLNPFINIHPCYSKFFPSSFKVLWKILKHPFLKSPISCFIQSHTMWINSNQFYPWILILL